MKTRVVTSLREFDALAPLWREVLEERGERSPFVSHDWFATCWRGAGPNRHREVTILEDSAGPVALFPLVRWRATRHGLPVRVLGFLDMPDAPFNEFVVARGLDEAIERFVASLAARGDWDVLSLAKIPAHSAMLKTLEAAAADLSCRTIEHEARPYLAVRGRWHDYLAERGPAFAATQDGIRARLHQTGHVTIDEHRDVDPDGPVFAELMDVSRHLWKEPTRVAVLTSRGMPRFFRELTPRLVANGWLRVWMLRLDGRPVASEYQLAVGDTVYALRGDGDPAAAELQPGRALTERIVRSVFDRGSIRHYHMGHPGMTHKFDWATGVNETVTFEVYAPQRYGRVLHGLEVRLMPLARQLRGRGAREQA